LNKLNIAISLTAGLIVAILLAMFLSSTAALKDRLEIVESQLPSSINTLSPVSATTVSAGQDSNVIASIEHHSIQISTLHETIVLLSSQLNQINKTLKELALAEIDLPLPNPATPEFEQPTQSRADKVAEQEQKLAEKQRQILDQFHTESIDEIWSQDTQIKLEESFSSTLRHGAEMTYLECHSSSCEARWRINQDLTDAEKFEFDNAVLVEMAKARMVSVNYLDSLDPTEFRVIVKKR